MAWREDAKFGKLRGTSLYLGSGSGTQVTSTAAELNALDGITSTYAELNILDGVTTNSTEFNLLDGVTATTAQLNYLAGVTAGTSASSKAVVLSASGKIDTIDMTAFKKGGTTIDATAAQLNFVAGVTAGTSAASKAVVLDASSKIDTIDMTAWKVGGTSVSSTAAELNILDGCTANSTELNYLDNVVAGTSAASKAVVLSATSKINAMDITALTLNGTAVTSTAAEVNLLSGMTGPVDGLATGYHLARGTATVTASLAVNTGLSAIVGAVCTLRHGAAPADPTVVTHNFSNATLTIYGWKATSANTTTLVASSTAATIHWIAVGT